MWNQIAILFHVCIFLSYSFLVDANVPIVFFYSALHLLSFCFSELNCSMVLNESLLQISTPHILESCLRTNTCKHQTNKQNKTKGMHHLPKASKISWVLSHKSVWLCYLGVFLLTHIFNRILLHVVIVNKA